MSDKKSTTKKATSAKKPVEDPAKEPVKAPVAETASQKKQTDQVFLSRAMKTKKLLEEQPKVKLLIPLKVGEVEGTVLDVTINGYRYSIPKNVMVDVPEAVAQIVAESERLTLSAGKDFKAGRSKEIDDALN